MQPNHADATCLERENSCPSGHIHYLSALRILPGDRKRRAIKFSAEPRFWGEGSSPNYLGTIQRHLGRRQEKGSGREYRGEISATIRKGTTLPITSSAQEGAYKNVNRSPPKRTAGL